MLLFSKLVIENRKNSRIFDGRYIETLLKFNDHVVDQNSKHACLEFLVMIIK